LTFFKTCPALLPYSVVKEQKGLQTHVFSNGYYTRFVKKSRKREVGLFKKVNILERRPLGLAPRGDRERGDPSADAWGDIPYHVLPRHASAEGSLTSFGTTKRARGDKKGGSG